MKAGVRHGLSEYAMGKWAVFRLLLGLAQWLVVAAAAAQVPQQWQYGGPAAACAAHTFAGVSPEAVRADFLVYANSGCNPSHLTAFAQGECTYRQAAAGATVGTADCYYYWQSTQGYTNYDQRLGVSKYCPTGAVYIGATHACECPESTTWAATANACVPVVDVEKGKPGACGFGNPIFPTTASKAQSIDLGAALRQPLSVRYDTRSKIPGGTAMYVGSGSPPSFGALWESSYHRKLVTQHDSSGVPKSVQAARGGGRWVSFVRSVSGTYLPDADVADRLEPVNGGWRYFDAQTRSYEVYDSSGVLQTISYASGGVLTHTYSDGSTPAAVAPAAGLLIKVEDQHGRAVRFEYASSTTSSAAHVVRLIDPEGRVTQIGYDTTGNLDRLLWPDGLERRYVYEVPALPWALTGIVDENSDRHSTYGYDAQGRATSTEYAGGVSRYALSYTVAPSRTTSDTYDAARGIVIRSHEWIAPQGTSVATPNGVLVSLGTSQINGMPRITSRSQPAGAGCEASTSRLTYDDKGNVVSRIDFNGSKSCYANDLSRNLEVVRVDGLDAAAACDPVLPDGAALPVGTRKTSTRWHPDWSQPASVASPRRLTTNVYNGQPDPFAGNQSANCAPVNALLPDGKPIAVLCKQVEQATVDDSGLRGFALSAIPGTPGDALYASVTTLLHLDGAHGSTAIVDAGPAARSWSTTGTAALSVQQSRFGGAAFQAGNGAAMSADLSGHLFGAGDFTVEAWVYKTSTPSGDAAIVNLWAPGQYSWFLGSDSGNRLTFYYSRSGTGGTAFPAFGTVPVGAWTHVAVSRSGESLLFFINGAPVGTTSISGSLFASSGASVAVGAQGNLINQWPGYIDEVRVTKGVARYTQAFALPTTAFGDSIAGTQGAPSLMDVAAVPQVKSWTYNEHGQVLTARDPLNKLTTYAYYSDTTDQHTMGDLQSVTDPAGRIAQYTRYDKSGRLMQSTDANGTVTDTTYTPRGWIKTVTVTAPGAAAQASLYDYDGVGQLKKATLPNGSALEYTYDAAHRLTSVKDAAGNSVTYTLDNMGNRTGEDLKDPSGTLARNITRVYDALNRVQSAMEAN